MPDAIPHDEHPFTPLRDAVALSIYLLQIDRVTCVEKCLHCISNMQPAIVCQQPLDILHDEPFGSNTFEQANVVPNQRIPRILARLHTRAAKPLTWRAA